MVVYLFNEILYGNENKGKLQITTWIKHANVMLGQRSQIQSSNFAMSPKFITSSYNLWSPDREISLLLQWNWIVTAGQHKGDFWGTANTLFLDLETWYCSVVKILML